jgi:hypothetical protein
VALRIWIYQVFEKISSEMCISVVKTISLLFFSTAELIGYNRNIITENASLNKIIFEEFRKIR